MPWSRAFDDPVPLPNSRELATLEEAARHIQKLPKAEQESSEWQTAAEALILAAEDRGPMMHARIGMLRAINAERPAPVPERRRRAKAYRVIR